MKTKILLPLWGTSKAVLLPALGAIVIFLQSCCITCPPWNYQARKAEAAAQRELVKKSQPEAQAIDVVTGQPAKRVSETNATFANESRLSAKKKNAIATTTATRKQPVTISAPIEIKERVKLPLGIKAIGSHLVAGPNMSFKSSDESDDAYGGAKHKHKPGVGVQFGIVSNFVFSERFAVSSGLLFKQNNASETLSYSTPGGTTGEPGGSYDYKYEDKYSYSYLSAPLLAEYKLSSQLTAKAGPELNYLLGASVKSSGGGESEKTTLTKNSVKLGVGVQIGLKYAIPSNSGNSQWGIQLIYDHRLSRLNKNESSSYEPGGGTYGYDTPAWHMKSIQLGVTHSLCKYKKKE